MLFPYRNYKGGFSYGLEFHFRWEELPAGGAIVFNVVDGAIWRRFPRDVNVNGWDYSDYQAANLCHALNGNPMVDTVGIDGTP